MSRGVLTTSSLSVCAFALGSMLALSSALAADFPTGTYEAKGPPYTVSFDAKGQFQVHQGEKVQVSGTYSVKAGEVQLTDVQGPWACTKDGEQTGTYAWRYEGAVLTLSMVNDKCADRVNSLINVAWKRQK